MKIYWKFFFVVSFQLLLIRNNSALAENNYKKDDLYQPRSCHQVISGQKIITQEYSPAEKAGEWLRRQQNSETGLLRSYNMPGDYKAWTYDQAVGILTLLAIGDPNTAKQCADGMIAVRREPDHVWEDFYQSDGGEKDENPTAVGPNAWMGLALLKLYEVTDDGEYLSAAEDIALFLLDLQSQAG